MTKAQSKTQAPSKVPASRKTAAIAEASPVVADKPRGKSRAADGQVAVVEAKPAKRAVASAVAEVSAVAVSAA
ncbi:MAG: hypothetical protein B7Z83_05005, partial [Thiomonas sp. 20-64-5]